MFNLIIKSFSLLEPKEIRKFYYLSILTIIAFILETASIGSIIPMLVFLTENQSNFIFFENFKYTEDFSDKEKLNFFVMVFVLLFLIKNIYLIFFDWYQNKFSAQLTLNLSSKLFQKYLNQSYLFFVRNNSAKLIRNIMRETERFSANVIVTNANLILEILVLSSISIILFLYDPKSFIFVTGIAILSFLLLSIVTRKKLITWAKDRATYEARVINKLQVSFSLYKIIKILFKNKAFNKDYFKNMRRYNHAIRNIFFITKVPRHTFEIVAVISLSALIFYLMKSNNQISELLVLLGLFAAAAFRILPAVIRIVVSLQSLRSNSPSIKILLSEFQRKELNLNSYNKLEPINFKKNIILKNINFKYPNTKKNVIKNLNLEIKKNEIIGIAGSSGSGKTTLIDIFMGLLKPDNGSLIIDGKKLKDNQNKNWNKIVGYVPQGVFLLDDTIEKNIAFGVNENLISKKKIVSCSQKAQLHNFIMSLPKKYKTKISERGSNLSEGQKQRISIARALYFEPQILILDEATSALDYKTEKKFINSLLKLKNKKTIIIIAHRFSILKYCRKIYFFDFNKNFRKVEKKYIKQIS